MRIAQVSPLIESVPPKTYGGTERIVSYITEKLVERGHDVTLFASADSVTKARLIPICEKSLRLDPTCADPLIYHILQIEEALRMSAEFDIIHFHNDYLHFPLSRLHNSYLHVTTLHGRLDLAGLDRLYAEYSEIPVISISDDQRNPQPHANWLATVYHGLPEDLYNPVYKEGKYLAFLGRISREKRPDLAIEIAKRSRIPLKIAAKVDKNDVEYYEKEIKHLLDDPLIEFIGEIGESEKQEFLGNAMALLFPIDWPEPFGLVMIESMATATPVIAFPCGSVPEVIDGGITGFIVPDVNAAVKAVNKIHTINREDCYQRFRERFLSDVMVKNYEICYDKMIMKDKNSGIYFFRRAT